MKTKLILVVIVFIIFSCKDSPVDPPEKPITSATLSGRVILENQNEHSNALIYIEGVDRGYSSDSSGNYVFHFTKADTVHNGEHKVYFFLYDYELDSAMIKIEKGEIKLNCLDVDGDGKVKTRIIKQMVRVEGWTDRKEYKFGDYMEFSAKITNVSQKTVHLFIPGFGDPFGAVYLYNENYPPYSITDSEIVPTADLNVFMKPGTEYYGKVKIKIWGFYPFYQATYLVLTQFIFNSMMSDRFNPRYNFENFIRNKWEFLYRGKTPKYDVKPQKFRFPIINVTK